MVHVPKYKNHVVVRLQNLADLYDSNSKTEMINLQEIAQALWKNGNMGNPTAAFDDLQIDELSLTGNMKLEEMWSRKIKWATLDDDSNEYPVQAVDYDFTPSQVKLEPQRIRVFSLKFTPQGPKFLSNN